MGIKEDQAAGKLKGTEQNYTEVCSIIEERQRRLVVFGKETVFYIFVSLVFSGCSSWLGMHQELYLRQLQLCNAVPLLYKVKGLYQVGQPTFILCVLCFTGFWLSVECAGKANG